MSNVKIFSTNSGMVIGKVTGETQNSYVVEDARLIIADMKSMQLIRFPIFGNNDTVEFNKNALHILPYDPDEELKKEYLSKLSNIELVDDTPKTIKLN